MQKLINVMAVASFIMSTGIIIGGSTIYHNRQQIADDLKDRLIEEVTKIIPEIVNGALGDFNVTESLLVDTESVPTNLPF